MHNSAICMKSENSREFGQDYNITGQFVPHYTSPTVTLDLAWNPLYFIILAPKVTSTRKWTIICHLLLNDCMNELGMFTAMKYIKEKFFCWHFMTYLRQAGRRELTMLSSYEKILALQ